MQCNVLGMGTSKGIGSIKSRASLWSARPGSGSNLDFWGFPVNLPVCHAILAGLDPTGYGVILWNPASGPKIMRKSDIELLEVRLEPLQTARDRLESDVGELKRSVAALDDHVKNLERNEEIHSTEIAQGLASIRSLLQRANRAAREQGIIEDEEPDPEVDSTPAVVNIRQRRDEVIRHARIMHPGTSLL